MDACRRNAVSLPVTLASLLCLLVCGGCAEDPKVSHRANGAFSYWPDHEESLTEMNIDGEEPVCTSEVRIADESSPSPGDYRLVVDCVGYFKGYWYFPSDRSVVSDIPAGESIEWRPSELLYYVPLEGSQRNQDSHWSEAWKERCVSTNRSVTGTFRQEETSSAAVNDRPATIRGELRFETPQDCLRGEIDFEINPYPSGRPRS